jgi:hypothetical protein
MFGYKENKLKILNRKAASHIKKILYKTRQFEY